MKLYRKKPVVVAAYQTRSEVKIATLEGVMTANPGDWIITGVKGEKYPCKPDIFEVTYEPIDDDKEDRRPEIELEMEKELHRRSVECEAWRSGLLWNYNGGFYIVVKQWNTARWVPTIDAAVDALMAEEGE